MAEEAIKSASRDNSKTSDIHSIRLSKATHHARSALEIKLNYSNDDFKSQKCIIDPRGNCHLFWSIFIIMVIFWSLVGMIYKVYIINVSVFYSDNISIYYCVLISK